MNKEQTLLSSENFSKFSYDAIESFINSTIHHGTNNKRVYGMSVPSQDIPYIIPYFQELAKNFSYEKAIINTSIAEQKLLQYNGYKLEASIPKLYNGSEDGGFFVKYFTQNRAISKNKETIDAVIHTSRGKNTLSSVTLPKAYEHRIASKKDIPAMQTLYKKVFASYPFPIYESEFIENTMDENVIYFGIWHNDVLIAMSAAEISYKNSNVEMTDFACLPEYRGENLPLFLLYEMEKEMKQQNIKTAFTIARSVSYGMNTTFSKAGYHFSGTLINNTYISGSVESMNVWYKDLS